MKIRLPKLPTNLFKHVKRTVLIAAGCAVLVCLFSYAVVRQVQAERIQKSHDAAAAASRQSEINRYKATISGLEGQVDGLQADKTAACSYLKTVSTQRATRSLVTVPTAVHCK